MKVFVNFVGGDDAVVRRAQPAGHDDADGACVIKPRDLFLHVHAVVEPFELCPERGAAGMACVALERAGRGGFDIVRYLSDIGDLMFKDAQCVFDEIFLALLILVFRQAVPIAEIGVHAGNDGITVRAWPNFWIID